MYVHNTVIVITHNIESTAGFGESKPGSQEPEVSLRGMFCVLMCWKRPQRLGKQLFARSVFAAAPESSRSRAEPGQG